MALSTAYESSFAVSCRDPERCIPERRATKKYQLETWLSTTRISSITSKYAAAERLKPRIQKKFKIRMYICKAVDLTFALPLINLTNFLILIKQTPSNPLHG